MMETGEHMPSARANSLTNFRDPTVFIKINECLNQLPGGRASLNAPDLKEKGFVR